LKATEWRIINVINTTKKEMGATLIKTLSKTYQGNT